MSESLKEKADKIRMDMILGAAEKMQDDLNAIDDSDLVSAVDRHIKIKIKLF